MKKFILILLFLPLIIQAQNFNGRFTSSFYTFQRFDNLQNSDTYIRNTEAFYLNFNYSKISLRTRFNFETNIGNKLDNDPRVRFYNLYLEARDILDFATIKIGRQPLFTPITGGLFDGVNLRLKYSDYAITAYYGGNLPAYQKLEFLKDLSENYVMGARFDASPIDHLNIAFSYIDKNFKPMNYEALRLDEGLDPIKLLIMQNSNQFKFASGELSFELPNWFEINGLFEYDLNYKEPSKIEGNGKFWLFENLGITGYYNWREPKIRYNSIFSVFNFGHTEEYEAGLDFKINNNYSFFGKFGNVKYEDENSSRLTVGAITNYGTISFRKSFGYAGELDNISFYTAKTFANGFITPSIGIAYTSYKLSKNDNKNNIISALAGVNIYPWKKWSFDLQGQYFNNKIYKNDFRVLLKVNHWFNTNF
ncbi:MAG: hypothetical protein N2321_00925 [Melioribacteraceae bacterium]|nr:hypothetical protein [Melioribacteraceae bacterium]